MSSTNFVEKQESASLIVVTVRRRVGVVLGSTSRLHSAAHNRANSEVDTG